uniref:Putative secreted protein n=1 Tax=Ixodes ricinus TaxID=34613 RepID=V5GIN2_IXORI
MLKLSFFIVLVLAGLCFGTSKTEEGVEGTNNSGNKEDEDQKEEKSPGAPQNITEGSLHMPSFVGDVNQKKDLLAKLVDICNATQPSTTTSTPITSKRSDTTARYAVVNQKTLNFTTCTFTCKPPTEQQELTLRMPKGTICNEKKFKCGETGDCPPMPVPAC